MRETLSRRSVGSRFYESIVGENLVAQDTPEPSPYPEKGAWKSDKNWFADNVPMVMFKALQFSWKDSCGAVDCP